MVIDASAIVAILADEPDAARLLAKLESYPDRRVSAISVFEAAVSLARLLADLGDHRQKPIPRDMITSAQEAVAGFLAAIHAQDIPVSASIGAMALDAAKSYGKFNGHKARLNFGDCFVYACAKSLGAPLLFKGDDFNHTDILQA